MSRRTVYPLLGGVLGLALVASLACGSDTGPVEDRVAAVEQSVSALQAKVASVEGKAGAIAVPAGEKNFYVTGVEWKGATSATKLAPPDVNPADLSDGFGFDPPGYDPSNPDKWLVETYVWTPGSMIAYQGDRVNLDFFIVNGNKHSTWVEAPDGAEEVKETEMNRGRTYQLSFVASQQGVYRLICNQHEPTMTAYILVLPRV